MQAGARPPRRVYSAPGGLRSAFVRARRRFPSSRRSRALLGRVVHASTWNGECGAQLLDESLDCELAVPGLASLVLRDRAYQRARPCDDPRF